MRASTKHQAPSTKHQERYEVIITRTTRTSTTPAVIDGGHATAKLTTRKVAVGRRIRRHGHLTSLAFFGVMLKSLLTGTFRGMAGKSPSSPPNPVGLPGGGGGRGVRSCMVTNHSHEPKREKCTEYESGSGAQAQHWEGGGGGSEPGGVRVLKIRRSVHVVPLVVNGVGIVGGFLRVARLSVCPAGALIRSFFFLPADDE